MSETEPQSPTAAVAAGDNPHLAVLEAMQRRREEEQRAAQRAAAEEAERRVRHEEAAHARAVQEEILSGAVNPHALIIARQAARRAELERQEAEEAEEKARWAAARRAKAQAEAAAAAAAAAARGGGGGLDRGRTPLAQLEACLGLLHVQQAKSHKWLQFLVELKDGDPATVSLYTPTPEGTVDATTLRDEVVLAGTVAVQEYVAPTSLTQTLSLRKPKPRPLAFSVFVGDSSFSFEAASEADRDRWRAAWEQYAAKYSGTTHERARDDSDNDSRKSSEGSAHTSRKRSSGIATIKNMYLTVRGLAGAHLLAVEEPAPAPEPVDIVVNPLQEDDVNVTFENKLFSGE